MYRNDTPSRVRRSLDNFEARRQVMLEKGLAVYADPESYPDPAARVLKRDIYAATAALNLFYGKYVRESIDQVILTAKWFDLPHPNGRDPRGESTFAAMGMLPTLYYNWDKLTDEARAAVDRFFLTKNFESMYESENHRLQHHTALYLAGQFYGERTFEWCGKTGTQMAAETGAWLKRFVHFRAKEGWGEFDSLGYLDVDFGCLLLLADLSRDKELATISRMMLDVLLLDMVVDSKNGLYGGAHGRIYPPTALNILCGGMAADYYLYIGLDNDESERRALKFLPGVPVAALMVDYRPDPVVLEMALGRVGAYENREAKHLHCIPKEQQPGRISKYTYVTDKYIVGAINRQDDYDPNTRQRWYAHHEQHELDALILADPRAKIFTHHPGSSKEHNRWTGDLGCCCVSTFAWHNVAMSMYDIRNPNEFAYINAHFNRDVMENVSIRGNWVFGEKDGVYAALYGANGWAWACDELRAAAPRSTEDHAEDNDRIELWSEGRKHACVIELSDTDESLDAFIARVTKNEVRFDSEAMTLSYTSGGHTLTMHAEDKYRAVDGVPVSFPYENLDSPYLFSRWDSEQITAVGFNGRKIYDFERGEIRTERFERQLVVDDPKAVCHEAVKEFIARRAGGKPVDAALGLAGFILIQGINLAEIAVCRLHQLKTVALCLRECLLVGEHHARGKILHAHKAHDAL